MRVNHCMVFGWYIRAFIAFGSARWVPFESLFSGQWCQS
jgi:hypothetical protein